MITSIIKKYLRKEGTSMNKIYINELLLRDLQSRYSKSTLTKIEVAKELNMSVSSINSYIVKGMGIPEYVKVGSGKNGTVLFPVVNVVLYLSNTIKVS